MYHVIYEQSPTQIEKSLNDHDHDESWFMSITVLLRAECVWIVVFTISMVAA